MRIKSFFRELKRRNIYRVAVVYAITGWILAQIASVAANAFGAPPWVMKMIITVILLGFPITLVITWAFEITPDGVKRTQGDKAKQQVGEGTFWLGIGLVTVFLFGGWYLTMESVNNEDSVTPQKITDRSIAVLPLKSVSDSAEPLPLAEGLHDDLLTRLANVSELKVISRTSVEKFQDTELTLPAIADSLNVKWILEGGVQKGGNIVQINAQLIDPTTDVHIWADTYQRELTANNIFAVQGQIAREIANALQAQLSVAEQERIVGAPTQNLEAYHLYVKGRQQLALRTFSGDEHVKQAIQFFTQAIEQDSSFALAWSGLADAAENYPDVQSDSIINLSWNQESAARRAVALNPDLAEAQTSMGFVHLRKMNAPEALKKLKLAIELKPSYWQAHHLLGELYLHIGYLQQALQHLKIAVDLNPKHTRARHWLYDAYSAAGEYQKSLQEARKQEQMGLEQEIAIMGQVRAVYGLGRLDEAYRLAEQQFRTLNQESLAKTWFHTYLVQILAAKGDTTGAQTYLRELEKKNPHPRFLGWAYFGIGNTDKALEMYEQINEKGWGNIATLWGLRMFGKEYPSLQKNTRYQQLIQKANQAWGLNPDGSIPVEANSRNTVFESL